LKKIFEFYEINSKIFPNYIILSESRYIYKNIQKKQKLIDQLQEMEVLENEKKVPPKDNPLKDRVLNTEECNSILNQTQSIYNFKSTRNNSFNNSVCSIEMLVNNIEKADCKGAIIGKKADSIRQKDSKLIVKKQSEKLLKVDNVKEKNKPSIDSQLTKSQTVKMKENSKRPETTLMEKNNFINKTPDKKQELDIGLNDFSNKDQYKLLNPNGMILECLNSIYASESKVIAKSRNQQVSIGDSKSNPKTFDQKIYQLKTAENQKAFHKRNSEASIPKFSLYTTNNEVNKNHVKKSSVISDSKKSQLGSKVLSDNKEAVPFKIFINLDNSEKKHLKQDPLSSRKFTGNIRSKFYIEQNNTTKGFNYLQLSSMNNAVYKTANKIVNDKPSSRHNIEFSTILPNNNNNLQKDILKNAKSRNNNNQHLARQDSLKNNNTNSNNHLGNLFLSSNNNKASQVNKNYILHLTQSQANEKKNHTPEFMKVNKNAGNGKPNIKNGEPIKGSKKVTDKSNVNKGANEKMTKLNSIYESSIVASVPNSARIHNIIEKKK
jgi:hypothetical protein